MKKIIVIGCPGSGKSSFSRALSEKTGIPLYHLDLIWHKADKTTVSREEFDASLSDILSRDEWIIDGNYHRTLPVRLAACDCVFVFDLPTDICLAGAYSRIGKQRPDLPFLEEAPDPEFFEYIRSFRLKKLPLLFEILASRPDKSVTVFFSHGEADKYIEGLP
jgi:adenylate kinase family enzyme